MPSNKADKVIGGGDIMNLFSYPYLSILSDFWGSLQRSWDDRTDVPAWLCQVSLVLNMHCEGWTGYVFNTFDRQLEILR